MFFYSIAACLSNRIARTASRKYTFHLLIKRTGCIYPAVEFQGDAAWIVAIIFMHTRFTGFQLSRE